MRQSPGQPSPASSTIADTVADPVNELLPLPRLFALGLQHLLVMYAGAIAVPLIVGNALGLSKSDLSYLVNCDLFAAGIGTLIQSLGFLIFGIRLPVMMGVTFAAVAPMIAIGVEPGMGLPGIFGASIVSGVFGIAIAPLMGRLLGLFPRVVTGTVIMLIGFSLLSVGINWAAGGQQMIPQVVDGVKHMVPNPAFGDPFGLAIAALVLVTILLLTKFGNALLCNIAVLLGIVTGTLVAAAFGKVSLADASAAPLMTLVTPFHFGMPKFELSAIISMCIVIVITLVESTGMFLALSHVVGKPISRNELTNGLRADGLATVVAGVFNTFPHTSFSQNIGLVSITGVRSRYVAAAGGLLLIVLGLFPKLSYVVASVPQYVLGGAGIVMFGMVAAAGIRMLGMVDFQQQRHNLLIIAVSVGFGMMPTLAPAFFHHFPDWTHPITHSGIVMGTLVAVVLNAWFNGIRGSHEVMHGAAAAAH